MPTNLLVDDDEDIATIGSESTRLSSKDTPVPDRFKHLRFSALPMNEMLFNALLEHPRHENSGHVFYQPDGSPYLTKR